ncbi:pyrimidine-nucleoside phosphorylase [Oceanobacillus oncorhynchi subsp. incaldanensis]|uniref:Pyrimidine-nucleoside phosphorylase n=1 Tax=Oceanobacillus oncorhynchi TaxID=545501 RepID=A0A0A1MW72_9BACI|nr:pyrimidine-nucleoside phosphorylase [Oceanobacillus oncorhynchi]UUI38146.1 pyrimidine-nucleoside phosphorylase [Oceanobacillus oncorhynchi]GIO17147.1 pyrimidine-nucleoside phosphorylase [Oceanobacillus oncorhynchi subsp. incaldanensis]CEI83804.1 Pyrimidine-nucleoside phosphorylase [Oceanobacillus oncorhynchi]
MNTVEIINKKKYGEALSYEEIEYMIDGYVNDTIPDYQIASWLMAVYFQGLNSDETSALTDFMVKSGETIDLSFLNTTVVDKHSTGGVGDKVSLVVAPIITSLGIPFAKMSGRGLGHTGGTVDKLESIKGFHTELPLDRFKEQVQELGIALVGQSGNLVPADKKIYALRDVTGTVDSIPLIASSIMSKKIASGADAIVLDIKVGNGAFMKTEEEARKLAETMVAIGKKLNRETVAVLTNMDQPLGTEIGNGNEVLEAVKLLRDQEYSQDLYDVSVEIAAQMVYLAGKATTEEQGRKLVEEVIQNGDAYEKFVTFIEAQDGDMSSIHEIEAKQSIDVTAEKAGYISSVETQQMGEAAMLLGAGRKTKDDQIDHQVGITFHVKLGDKLEAGDKLATIHTNIEDNAAVIQKIKDAITITETPVQVNPSVIGVIH